MNSKERQLNVLNNMPELMELYIKYKYADYMFHFANLDNQERDFFSSVSIGLGTCLCGYNEEDIRACEQILRNKYKRVKRLKNNIKEMLEHEEHSVFITLTFDNDCLNRTSKNTRRYYVSHFLKSISTMYNANIDYGKENGREHYHACVNLNLVSDYSMLQKIWKSISHQTGNLNIKQIHGEEVEGKLARYISKLSLHAFKTTTKQCRIIYSRSK